MNEAWPTVKLGDIAEVTSSKRIKMADYVKSGVPFYRSKEIIERSKGKSISTELFITEEYFSAIDQKFGSPSQGDILLTSVGTLGVPYQVKEGDRFYFKDGNLTWFRNYKPDIDADFLLCWLTSSIAKRRFDEVTIGSTQKALTIIALKSIDITLPPLVEQKAIASVLGTLDDKIENNRRMNETLEEMARAIFKSWFVDFDPVHAKAAGNSPVHMDADTAALFPSSFSDDGLPVGWFCNDLSNVCSLLGGYAFKSKEFVSEGMPVVKIKNITGNGNVSLEDAQCVLTGSVIGKDKFKLSDGDLLIAMTGATVGKTGIVTDGKMMPYLNQRVGKFVPNLSFLKWAIWAYMQFQKNVDAIVATGTGSAQTNISSAGIVSVKWTEAPHEIYKVFDEIVAPYFDLWISNTHQNKTLAKLRDTLLPKLMSGEIRVADAEREVEANV